MKNFDNFKGQVNSTEPVYKRKLQIQREAAQDHAIAHGAEQPPAPAQTPAEMTNGSVPVSASVSVSAAEGENSPSATEKLTK